MTWDYRVMDRDGQLAIHEVFYRDDGSVEGYTELPVHPRAGTIDELREELRRYASALDREMLPFAQPGVAPASLSPSGA